MVVVMHVARQMIDLPFFVLINFLTKALCLRFGALKRRRLTRDVNCMNGKEEDDEKRRRGIT